MVSSRWRARTHSPPSSSQHTQTTEIAKILSEEWKFLSHAEKAVWEEESLADRARYQTERAAYNKTNPRRHTKTQQLGGGAPKRPMSAYLMFSNARRGTVKKEHPELSNGDLSRALSKQWREASPSRKAEYVQREQELRQQYKVDMTEWRKQKAENEKKERKRLRQEARRQAQVGSLLGLNPRQVEVGLAQLGSGSATTGVLPVGSGGVLPMLGTGTAQQLENGSAQQLGTGAALQSLASPPLVGNVSLAPLGRLVSSNSSQPVSAAQPTIAGLDRTRHGVQVNPSVVGNGLLGVTNPYHVPAQASLQQTLLATILGTLLRLSSLPSTA